MKQNFKDWYENVCIWLHWMLLQCLHYFRQNALDFNVQGRNEHTPLYVTAVEYFIVLYYNVHDSSVLACSVIIVQDKSEYVCNFAVLKSTWLLCIWLQCTWYLYQWLQCLHCTTKNITDFNIKYRSYYVDFNYK